MLFSAVKGNHLLGGDIALSTEEARLLHWNTAEAGKDLPAALSTKTRRTRAVVKLGRKKWVAGEVPYELSSDFSKYRHACMQRDREFRGMLNTINVEAELAVFQWSLMMASVLQVTARHALGGQRLSRLASSPFQ